MTAYFFDSSALVKRYVRETGTTWVIGILRSPANSIYVAQIAEVEVAAVFVSSDIELNAAAAAAGLQVEDPNAHP